MAEETWSALLGRLVSRRDLTEEGSAWAMEQIMQGQATPAQFGAFVAALRSKGESIAEISGLVHTMRRNALRVEVTGSVVDTCGTGGDRSGTVNVSTIAAFVAAGAGARVAKHGNRAASSNCGSADLLEALGVKIGLDPEGVARCIEEASMGFCFAPIFHPAMRHAVQPRRELAIPTVFNFLGPLTNPAGAGHQVIGVSDAAMAPKIAGVLAYIGTVHTLVVHGADGLDEISTTGPSQVWEIRGHEVDSFVIDAADFGVARADVAQLAGGTVADNVAAARNVLAGKSGSIRDIVAVNAGAALYVYGLALGFEEGFQKACEAITSGAALSVLERLVEVSNRN